MAKKKAKSKSETRVLQDAVGVVVHRLVRALLTRGEADVFVLTQLSRVGPWGTYNVTVGMNDRSLYKNGHGDTPAKAVREALQLLRPNE